jgi:hypothetical protein
LIRIGSVLLFTKKKCSVFADNPLLVSCFLLPSKKLLPKDDPQNDGEQADEYHL